MKELKHVLIMAGGTGGHVFPGLAVAEYLKNHDVKVSWLGTSKGLEAELVPEANIPFHTINITGLRGKGIATLLLAPVKVLQAVWQARLVLKAVKPDVVLGMGGFASGPGGIAAFFSGTPLVIHEQNAKAGLTNKVLSYFAKFVLAGFPGAFAESHKVVVVGNPSRKEIELVPGLKSSAQENQSAKLRLLVLGGSLGAKAINDLLPKVLANIPQQYRPEIWHQTGKRHYDDVCNAYKKTDLSVKVEPFIKDMASAYQWADMVLCRAGALTVTELCTAGVGAVLIPYPYAVDDHQTANAEFMVKGGAGICMQQSHLNETILSELIENFTKDKNKWQEMAQSAYRLRKIDVPREIFAILGKALT